MGGTVETLRELVEERNKNMNGRFKGLDEGMKNLATKQHEMSETLTLIHDRLLGENGMCEHVVKHEKVLNMQAGVFKFVGLFSLIMGIIGGIAKVSGTI